MIDDNDQATAFEELRRNLAMAHRKPEGPQPIGVCHFCGEAVGHGMRWCNRDCMEDWEAEKFQEAQRCT